MAAMAQTLETAPAKATRREWIGLAVIALPCLLYAMDLTVLTLAIPSLAADLNPTSTELLWIVDIYGFLVAGFLITMGTLGDRIGRRRLLLIGAAAFGAASVLAAFATDARDADRLARAARDRRRDARALDAVADPQHVPRRPPAHDRDRDLGHELLDRRGDRPAGRRRPARELPLGLGLPARGAGDGGAAGGRPEAPPRVQGPEPGPARPGERRAVPDRGAGRDLRDQGARQGRARAARHLGARRRARDRRRVHRPPAPPGRADDRPRPLPPPRVQPLAEREHAGVRGRLRARGLRRPVLPARARLLAARGGPLEPAGRPRVRRRLAAHPAARGADPPARPDAGRDRGRDRRRRRC